MTRTLVLTIVWLLAGSAVSGGAYYAFLLTPESTVPSLALSSVLLLVALALVAITSNGAVLAWRRGWSLQVIREAVAGVPAYLLPLVLAVAAWWIVGRGVAWVDAHSGEISAWFIARFGWADVTWLFGTTRRVGMWLQYVAAPLVALTWLRGMLTSGWRPHRSLVRQAFSPARHLTAAMLFAALVWMPWNYLVTWRPANVPLSLEVLFVGGKLGLVALLAATGVALIIRTAATEPTT
jgi:hypothetical protein